MRAEAIFGPMCILALWTISILALTGFRRVHGTLVGRIPVGAFNMGESADVPRDVRILNRNLMNLLEMPVLFYVACIALYITGQVRLPALVLAWVYVLLRVVHTLIHTTNNRIIPRLVSFVLSNFVLLAIWIWFAARVL
jgi:hypothetical protein